jgi:hypothetical protein
MKLIINYVAENIEEYIDRWIFGVLIAEDSFFYYFSGSDFPRENAQPKDHCTEISMDRFYELAENFRKTHHIVVSIKDRYHRIESYEELHRMLMHGEIDYLFFEDKFASL